MPQGITFIQAAPTLAFLAFSVAFAALYAMGVSRRAAGLFSLAYLLGALAFALEMMPRAEETFTDRTIINGLYTLVSGFTVFAIFARYERKPPRALIASIAALTMLAYAAACFATGASLLRASVINAGNGLLLLVAFPALGGRLRGTVDQLLAIVFAIFIAQFFFRPVLTYLLHDGAVSGAPKHVA